MPEVGDDFFDRDAIPGDGLAAVAGTSDHCRKTG
jgi:hypothetical protein